MPRSGSQVGSIGSLLDKCLAVVTVMLLCPQLQKQGVDAGVHNLSFTIAAALDHLLHKVGVKNIDSSYAVAAATAAALALAATASLFHASSILGQQLVKYTTGSSSVCHAPLKIGCRNSHLQHSHQQIKCHTHSCRPPV